ncbi:LuxR C-terminal-related transcriptional regulator [Williamsia sterculiae]|uniref:Regulatory protein, luxR family n=1 Tax=Williamsia sterculiae TaxID=1344003 RepID=A0A1N7ECA4_9NOCA|nr:LuxR family transcriptional regulator [Williamsia sterculiae]SIR85694.1 regulatory protein, luxR family [Williamsia sterculiae]
MNRRWPVVEREREFQTIRSSLISATGVCGVVLTGDAGVGKTTLARQVTSTLDHAVRWVAGTESARTIPLGVFAHLVDASTSSDPVTFLSAARQSLLAAGQSVIVGVDDAHLLDELSATLLHQLAIDRSAHIIATVRDGEAVPDAVTSLWKDGHLDRIDLTPFTQEQSISYIEAVLGGPLEGLSADLMWRASGGNALFLHHLVEGALEADTLRQVRGVWQLRGRTAVTSELASLLESRIDNLGGAVSTILKLLTLCEPIDLDVLTTLVDEDAVDDAEMRGLIRIEREGRGLQVRYTHPLYGDVVRRRLGFTASRRLRGQLVAVLRTRRSAAPADRIRLAELALDSDETVDKALLQSAANDAITMADAQLGQRFAEAALAAGAGLPAADLLARAHLWQGHPHESEQTLSAYDPDTLDDLELCRWGLTRICNLWWAMGDADRAEQILTMVSGRVTEPVLQGIIRAVESACAVFADDLSRAERLATATLDDPAATPWATEWACFGGGLALALSGRGLSVDAIAARGRTVVGRTDGFLRYPAGLGEVLAFTLTGRLAQARQAAGRFTEFSSAGQLHAWAMAALLIATVDIAEGRFDTAIGRLRQILAVLDTQVAAAWGYPARVLLVQAYAATGRADDADRTLADAIRLMGRYVAVFAPQLQLARSWAAAAQGVVGDAVDIARRTADLARDSGQRAMEAEALHTAARFGDTDVADRLGVLADELDGDLVTAHHRHARALADGDGTELDAVAADYERIGALLSAADAAAQAATAHDRHDRRGATSTSAANATRLAARCSGATTPALRAAAQPLPLTMREREIGTLVAAGFSNRAIADRLTVSVRTVEGHIYRACTKLDVSDRAGLADVLGGQTSDTVGGQASDRIG